MCGRFVLALPFPEIARLLDARPLPGVEERYRPSWNVAPTAPVLAVRSEQGERVLDMFRWGLVPSWAKDPATGVKTFNARAETVATKPTFRAAFRRQRIAVVSQGYYEWRKGAGNARDPFFFHRADGDLLTKAGLYDTWRDRRPGPEPDGILRTSTIITTQANADAATVHDRMPAILSPDALKVWLDPLVDERDELEALLRPAPTGTLTSHQVDRRVGAVRYDDPELTLPVAPRET